MALPRFPHMEDEELRREMRGLRPAPVLGRPLFPGPGALMPSSSAPSPSSRPLDPRIPPEVRARFAPPAPDADAVKAGVAASLGQDLHDAVDPASMQVEQPADPNAGFKLLDALGSGLAGKQYDTGYWSGVDRQRQERADRAEAEGKLEAERSRQERQNDPTSTESRAAQQSWGPYLKSAGYTDEEVGKLSAAQLRQFDVSGIVAERQRLKQQDAERARKATEDETKRQNALADKKEIIDYTETARAKRKPRGAGGGGGVAPASVLDDAEQRLVEYYKGKDGGVPAEVQARLRAIRGMPAKQQAAAVVSLFKDLGTGARRDEHQDQVDADKFNLRVKQYGTALEGSNIPKVQTVVARIRANIAAAKRANNGEIFKGADELLRRSGAPGAASAMSPSAKRIMEDVQQLQNIQIKDTSGAAVTPHEMPRVQKALGTGVFSNEEDLERYVDRYAEEVDSVARGWQRAYGDDVAKAYASRGRELVAPPPTTEQQRARAKQFGPQVTVEQVRTVRVRDPKTGREVLVKDSPDVQSRIRKGVLVEVTGG